MAISFSELYCTCKWDGSVLMCARPRAANLDIRSTITVATWNVLTLNATGAQCACWSDTRCHSQALLRHVLLVVVLHCWSRHVRFTLARIDHHVNGVALIKRRPLLDSLASWQGISGMLLLTRFIHRHGHITVVVTYAPTEDSTDVTKDIFYDQLERILRLVPVNDQLIVLGDLNATTGTDNLFWGSSGSLWFRCHLWRLCTSPVSLFVLRSGCVRLMV